MYGVNIVEVEVCHKGMNAMVLQIFIFLLFHIYDYCVPV